MQRIIGIDFGDARIGIALSDELGMLAHPLTTLHVKKIKNPVEEIRKLLEQHHVKMIVLGLPRNMDGTYGEATEKARNFGTQLQTKLGCEIKYWDERLTSVAAQRSLHESGRNTKNSRDIIDQVAAQIILQSYLDSLSMGMP